MAEFSGQCLCGQVGFEASGILTRTTACYCSTCRTLNGGGAFHGVEIDGALTLTQQDGLKWYASSDKAERGFCHECGSSLFWRLNANPAKIDISLGVLDDTSNLTLDAHIFADNCADYQTLPNDAPHLSEAECLAKYS